VTDFLSVGTFPIFNIADTCLTVGCGLMLVCLFFFEKGIFENHGRAETDKTP
jgi:lipoprotein signal peptidase